MICLDARHASAALKMQMNKTDQNDAEGLAQIMRTGCLDQTAVSVSRLVLGTRIDAEFLSDMGELFRVRETAVCHHRAQGR